MKQKTRKLSIRYKILLPSALLIVMMCAILGGNSYIRIQSGMIDIAVEEASLAAKVAASDVNPTWIHDVVPGAENSVNYLLLLSQLRELKEECGMLYMYTVYLENGKSYYGIDADESEDHVDIGEEFSVSYETLQPVMNGEVVSTKEIESENGEKLISVYAPIYDGDKVIGILGCDYNAKKAAESIKKTLEGVVVISIACMLLAIVVINIIIQAIMKNLVTINGKIYDLVNNEGDLTQTLDLKSGDETELIAENINSLLKYIHEIMSSISANSNRINEASNSMVDNVSDAEINITDVSATMQQMSAAMQETSASMNQIADSVARIYDKAKGIHKSSKEGMSHTEKVRANATKIRTDAVGIQSGAKQLITEMTTVMTEKIEHSKAVQEINELTENILNITEQTNLLSLNASIEAARAGEAGKGFAVVADEIGKLANSSSEIAEKIQQVSSEVISAVDDLSKEAERMVAFINNTAMNGYQSLVDTGENYKNDAGRFYEMMDEFSQTADDLQESMDSIKEAVEAINIAVEESAKGVGNVSEKAVNLSEIINAINEEAQGNREVAGDLNREVGKFKL